MRKSILMGLGLAGMLAGVAAAQQPGADAPKRDRSEDHRGRGEFRGGPGGLLLKDINLTDAQKTQLKQLHESQRAQFDANREQMKKQMDEVRAARQRGDTAAVRAIMERNRPAMEARRQQDIAALRNILTADQRVQFDKNVAALKQRELERGNRVGQRGDKSHGSRGGKPGKQG